jgi:hypothetical protein
VSAALHAVPFIAVRYVKPKPLDIEVRVHAVEIGLEQAQPGARTPPPAPAPQPSAPSAPPSPAPPPPREPARSVPRERPPPREPEEPLPLPPPNLQLREPQMVLARRRPPRVPEPVTPPAPRDAGVPAAIPHTVPTFASAAGDLAPMVPRGAVVTLLLRSDRIRSNPNAGSVRRLLGSIPDWEQMLGGSNLDPIDDLDLMLLAAGNPFGADGRPPDWFVLARGAHGSDARLRRAVEAMAAADEPLAPSPLAPPDVDGSVSTPGAAVAQRAPDAGRSPWQSGPGGAQIANLERYGARRSFVMLGNGMAAIALPGQVERLLSVMAQRGEGLLGQGDPRLVLLLEAEGVRNLIEFHTYHGWFPMPRRAAFALYQLLDESGEPTGAAELVGNWLYDDAAQAQHARDELEYSRGRWHLMIQQQTSAQGGLSGILGAIGASVLGIDVPAIRGAIDAMHVSADGERVEIRASLSAQQVRALLHLLSMGGAAAR